MKRTFVELPAFSALIRSGRMADEQLRQLQADIIAGRGVLIPGTGGLRKIRCVAVHGGKRGGWRVVFADYPAFHVTLLVTAFAKNVQDNLSAAEVRDLRNLKALVDSEMEARYGPKK
ncbi:MAG: hypothetical protein FJ288_11255 [Planctomycetes bacterium]|nr:hypothetical protein [Planctomycetota bacterium]